MEHYFAPECRKKLLAEEQEIQQSTEEAVETPNRLDVLISAAQHVNSEQSKGIYFNFILIIFKCVCLFCNQILMYFTVKLYHFYVLNMYLLLLFRQ